MSIIKVICAWCGKDMGEKDGQGAEGISHGMCDKCYTKQRRGDLDSSATPPGTAGYSADIYAKGSRRVLVDKNSGEVICRYVLEKGPGDEKRNAGNAEKGVKA